MSTGFNLKSSAALTPNKRVRLSFEVFNPGIDFSLVMNVLDGIFLQEKAFVYIKIMLSIILARLSFVILARSSGQVAVASTSAFVASPYTLILWRPFLSFSFLMNQPLLASRFSSAASSLLSAFIELNRELGPCSGLGLT